MKWTKRIVAMVLAVTMMLSLMSCKAKSESAGSASSSGLPEYTITAFFPGDRPIDFDEVLAEVENQLKDTLNVKLDFQFVPWSDYADKIKVKMSAGDSFDLHLNAPWLNMQQLIDNGSIQSWDPLIEQYCPAITENFPQIMLDSNRFQGQMMGIPLGPVLAGPKMLPIRKDLREKYGMDPIKNLDDFETYLRNVKENEPGMAPITWLGNTYYLGENYFHNYTNWGQNSCAVYIHYDENGKPLPIKPIYEDEVFLKWCEKAYLWQQEGLIDKNIMSQTDEKGAFLSGKAACANVDPQDEPVLQSSVPGGEIEAVYFEEEPGNEVFVTDFKMWNFLCINSNSKDPERVAKFMNWIYEDQAHYDLLAYGIEGKHWVDTGDKTYSLPEGKSAGENYVFPAYVLMENPAYNRVLNSLSDGVKEFTQFRCVPENFILSELSNFTPNYSNVETQIAKVSAIWPETILLFGAGMKNPAEMDKAIEMLRSAGYDEVVQEAQRQVDEYLAAQK